MFKKIVLTLIVAVAITCSAFASVLQLGVTGSMDFDVMQIDGSTMDSTIETVTDINKYALGAEARLNVSFLQLNATLQTGDMFKTLNGVMGAGIKLGPDIVNIAAGIAAPYAFSTEEPMEGLKTTLDQEMQLRLGVNANILFAGLGISYYVPTGVALNKVFSPDIAGFKPDFSRGKLGVSLMLNLI